LFFCYLPVILLCSKSNFFDPFVNNCYEIISKAAEQKKQELRKVYRDALAQKGIKGAAALKSPEYKLFKKQNADMSIMLGTAMRMAVDTSKQGATATGGGITVRND
jgi:hypothetical protein